MYQPEHFKQIDSSAIDDLISAHPLAAVTYVVDTAPNADHIPLLRVGNDMMGHIALNNDMHRLLENGARVLAIFRAENAYVSPNWYPSKPEHHKVVPTWNYDVVHVHGAIHFDHSEKSKRAVVGRMTKHFEAPDGWRMADAPSDYMDGMIANIVAIRIEIDRIEAKSKLSQNKEQRDILGAAQAIEDNGDAQLADKMRLYSDVGSK
ncbi:transcriptional regulator [Marivivens niveibacter]|uniref:Transcriptional regulator n=1 Tax=Marivivens niveibacter TaxID=1930667 RepID=A0A251X2M5_9RHOB|nr:FMN-binding negative transcriptional regulator [Marivivens niveibacter]OUD10856.1 transcriptional regulator [Marivivens niveibacter]